MNKLVKLVFCAVLLFAGNVRAGDLTTQIENTKVPYGETFKLTISYDGDDGSAAQPDLAVLQNDFNVYSSSSRIQSSFVNGKGEFRREWIIDLMPKKEGKVTIPSISVGQHKTDPIDIEVAAADDIVVPDVDNNVQQKQQNNNVGSKNFALDLEVQNITPFVQQEINAMLTLEDNKGLDLTSEPIFEDSKDWIIKKLDQPEIINQNGRRIIKFFYALFPQKSGQLQIPTAHVDGSYLSFEDANAPLQHTNSFFNMFDFDLTAMFGTRRAVHLATKPQTVYVKPIPQENEDNWWLPASALKLTARWSDERPIFKVGEAVSREIVLTASGVADTQLPDLVFKENASLKQYPEKPQFGSTSRNGQIVSQATVRVVYIPQKSGKQIIPEISVPWYNTTTKRMELAVIKEEEMAIGGDDVISTEQNSASLSPTSVDVAKKEVAKKQTLPITPSSNEQTEWYWLFLAFVAGFVVSFLLRRSDKKDAEQKMSSYIKKAEKDLLERDYRSLKDNLLAWGQKAYVGYSVRNLNDLSELVNDSEFSKQMETLNSILYAGNTAILDKDIIIYCMKNFSKRNKKEALDKPLPDLYK